MPGIDLHELLKRLDAAIDRNAQYIERAKYTPGEYLDALKYDGETLAQAREVVAGAVARRE